MNKGEFKDLLDNLETPKENNGERYLLIDGLNLFFRNFTMINSVNSKGFHIGGLGGFFRSLGFLINNLQPTQVYVVFDGLGSTIERKNIIPEYKSQRNQDRLTNWDVFDDLEEEDLSKVDQISKVISYLQNLPVKTVSIDRSEADDIIAHLSKVLPTNPEDKIVIVSADHDFLQLINEQVVVWLARKKELYDKNSVLDHYGVLPQNFLIYKTLMGDQSDNITGIKGLGKKSLLKRFPQLWDIPTSLDGIFKICEENLKEHISYARILEKSATLEKSYRIMDLNNPMVSDSGKEYLKEVIKNPPPKFKPDNFIEMWQHDELGKMIRNVDTWVKDTFKPFI